MLLQSKYYGSFRYWLFGLDMPTRVRKAIESDAKYYIWSAAPNLQSNEVGTSAGVAPSIHEKASHLPIKRGGAGLMHWSSHITAFKLQWIYRYIEPREAPWKQVLDHWIANAYPLGRAALLAKRPALSRFHLKLPVKLTYLRSCFREFEKLQLRQDVTAPLTANVQAEPLFQSWRFDSGVDPLKWSRWAELGPDEWPVL